MPKKVKARKNTKSNVDRSSITRELLLKDKCQEYARATKMLGNYRIDCECFDGKNRIGTIRGGIRKRTRFAVGDIMLVSLRDYQDDKADIIHVFTHAEVKRLQKMYEIPRDRLEEELDDLFIRSDDESEDESEDEKIDIDFI